jgi:hypothetical protein
MMQDDESKMPGQTKIITITTPDILSGKIKGIEIKNEMYHNVCIKFDEGEGKSEASGKN